MTDLMAAMAPELFLIVAACVLFLMGTVDRPDWRRGGAWLAVGACVLAAVWQLMVTSGSAGDPWGTIRVHEFARYVKILVSGMGALLVLLNWPTNSDATGGRGIHTGADTCEFLAMMLLSLAGVCIVAGANDLVVLFLGIELASIPTYIMVSISRPLPASQEAGVKYFFLGAMAAALMLLGLTYLYGTTGTTRLDEIGRILRAGGGGSYTSWQMLGVVLTIIGFAFKMAAVPLYSYVGDVYTGAATPVTAFLAFVPKTAGFVALIRLLSAAGGSEWAVPESVVTLLWIIAALTMTVGNTLALWAPNLKRMLAYSSVAHSGYMLVGITALLAAREDAVRTQALSGVLFYLLAYGVMNTGAFGVLMLLPSRKQTPVTTAETFDDIAGVGRKDLGLGLAMAVSCFSLIGLPLTVGFLGKLAIIQPALGVGTRAMNWLAVITVVNAAIAAAYYLRVVATMFLRPEPSDHDQTADIRARLNRPAPVLAAVGLSVLGVLLLGMGLPIANRVQEGTRRATVVEPATGQPATAIPALPSRLPQ